MPEMNGQQLTEKLREMNPRIDVLYASGYTDDTAVRYGVYEADTNFIQKPFSRGAIATKIREIFDNPD